MPDSSGFPPRPTHHPYYWMAAAILLVALAAFYRQSLVGGAAALALSAAMLAFARRQRRLRCLTCQQQQAAQSASCFQQFFELTFSGMGTLDADTLNWQQVNPQLCALLGYSEKELVGAPWSRVVKEPATIEMTHRKGGCTVYSTRAVLLRKNGSTFPATLDIKEVTPPGLPPHLMVVVQDLTERQLQDARAARLSLLREAVGRANHAVAYGDNPSALLPRVCEDTVIYGGMSMAWVGLVDAASKDVRVAACYGAGAECLLGAEFSADPRNPTSCGPTGAAILSGEPAWGQDPTTPTSPPSCRGAALEHGWSASAALPLRRGGQVVGALTLYAREADAFTPTVRRLLGEMAADIGFALDNFALQEARERATAALQDSEMFHAEVIDSLPEQVVVVDDRGRIVTANRPWRRFLRDSNRHDLALNFKGMEYLDGAALIPGPAGQAERWELLSGIRDVLAGRAPSLDMRYRCANAQGDLWFRVRATPLSGRAGAIIAHENVTQHEAALAHIQQLAHFDPLTDLPNRVMLADRVAQDICRASRRGEALALMFIDLDRFKVINDSLGHRVGDGVLRQVAARLSDSIRTEDTVSRLGGDEFILLLPNTDAAGAAHVAQALLDKLTAPCYVDQHELVVSASMGIAMYPADGLTYEDLSRSADAAMYRAKRAGRGVFQFFTAEMHARSVRTLRVETALRWAIDQSQLKLHYQPQMDLETGVIVGAEALLRWHHPELGEVSPAEFIPIAEDSGLILPIGEWVLREAARQLQAWQGTEMQGITVAVNLSAVQFRQAGLPASVVHILEEAGVPPELLELELTEGTTMEDPEASVAMMAKLRDSGIGLAIDDFGVGYSSLSHLKRFRLSKLKIDQSFVKGIATDEDDRAIVRALLTLAQSLGLDTMAEGVSDPEHVEFLRAHGCTGVQGYFVSEPLSPDALVTLVRDTLARRLFQGLPRTALVVCK